MLIIRDGYCLKNFSQYKRKKVKEQRGLIFSLLDSVGITTTHIPAVRKASGSSGSSSPAFWIHLALSRCLCSFLEKYSLIVIMQFPFWIYLGNSHWSCCAHSWHNKVAGVKAGVVTCALSVPAHLFNTQFLTALVLSIVIAVSGAGKGSRGK